MLPTAVLAGVTTYLVITEINGWGPPWLGLLLAPIVLVLVLVTEDRFYFRLSMFRGTSDAMTAGRGG